MTIDIAARPRHGHVASAELVVSTGVDGASRCTTNRSAPPLTFRSTPIRNGAARLTSVGTAAGPVGGDRLHLNVEVYAGSRLAIDSAGASLVLPGPHGEESSLETAMAIGVDAAVHFWPEPTVLVAGCRHRTTTRITVGAQARVVWAEELILGRHGEPPGTCRTRLIVDRSFYGRQAPVVRTGLDIGGIGWPGGAIVRPDTRLVAQALLIGIAPRDISPPDTVAAATTAIDDDAWLVTVVASTTEAGRAYLAEVTPDRSALVADGYA